MEYIFTVKLLNIHEYINVVFLHTIDVKISHIMCYFCILFMHGPLNSET